jgi:hypothetical protein
MYTLNMSRNKIIFIIGIVVLIMPFLGFPSAWKTIFYIIAGAILVIIAIHGHIRRRSRAPLMESREVVTEVFVETNGTKEM